MSQFRWLVLLLWLVSFLSVAAALASKAAAVDVTDFLPDDFVRDGSIAYHDEIQAAIDQAAKQGAVLVFPAMKYAASEEGWQLRSRSTLRMQGAVFQLSAECEKDGAVFRGEDVSDVTLVGGEIVGRNDVWRDGVNVRGIYLTGASERIRIAEMKFRDLSSNGIGVFGKEDSVREDQGDVAFYYVEDFVVDGCRFEVRGRMGRIFIVVGRGRSRTTASIGRKWAAISWRLARRLSGKGTS